MLNALPGVYIAGENAGQWITLSNMYDRLNQTKFGVRNAINSISWAHKFVNKSKVLCSMQRLAYDMIGGTTEHTIGWKAIRFSRESLEFMPILFPCAKYILNWRKNITAQMQSGW